MASQPREPVAVIVARLPESMLTALDHYAYNHNMSRAAALAHAVATLTDTPNTHVAQPGPTPAAPDKALAARKASNRKAAAAYKERKANAKAISH